MSYGLRLSRRAERYLLRLDRPTQERIARMLRAISEEPYGHGTKELSNLRGERAARVGSWRIAFEVDEDRKEVVVDAIGPRGQVYRDL